MSLAFRIVASLLLSILAAAPVAAEPLSPRPAPPPAAPPKAPMRVQVVREDHPDCGTTCAEWISAEGDFVEETPKAFRELFKTIGDRRLPILMHSRGGSTEAAREVGRLLRRRHAALTVNRTLFSDCATSDAACRSGSATPRKGLPLLLGDCLSACVFALAGAETRLAGLWSRVGVHQVHAEGRVLKKYRVFYKLEGGRKVETGRELISEEHQAIPPMTIEPGAQLYHDFAAYFREMGVGDGVVPLMESTPPSGIRILTRSELETTHLVTGWGDWRAVMPSMAGPGGTAEAGRITTVVVRPVSPPASGLVRPVEPAAVDGAPVARGVTAWATTVWLRDGAGANTDLVTFEFRPAAEAGSLDWRVAVPGATLPDAVVDPSLRLDLAGGTSSTAVAPAADEPAPAATDGSRRPVILVGRLPFADFCRLGRDPPAAYRLAYARADRTRVVRSGTIAPLRGLPRMGATVCPR